MENKNNSNIEISKDSSPRVTITLILKNQEERTEELLSLENFFNKLLQILEKEWTTEKKTHNWDYAGYCKKYIEKVGSLNKELRNFQTELNSHQSIKRAIDSLLSLEENNYKVTIGIFCKKIRHYDLLKKDSEEEEFEKNEDEIIELKMKLIDIRVKISELIQELVYYC